MNGTSPTNIIQSKSSDNLKVKQLWEELPDSDLGSGGEYSQSVEEGGNWEGMEGGATTRPRGRKSKDVKYKLERSRQSARECRARKKLRYQYLDDMILERERANKALIQELEKYVSWCSELDMGRLPDGWNAFLQNQQIKEERIE